ASSVVSRGLQRRGHLCPLWKALFFSVFQHANRLFCADFMLYVREGVKKPCAHWFLQNDIARIEAEHDAVAAKILFLNGAFASHENFRDVPENGDGVGGVAGDFPLCRHCALDFIRAISASAFRIEKAWNKVNGADAGDIHRAQLRLVGFQEGDNGLAAFADFLGLRVRGRRGCGARFSPLRFLGALEHGERP
ncbi:MAG: hypothetical protein LBM92_02985, partial [Opitutaceae bacterium]|nr:hypothetical protein [Opitutaceae bacterium]